MLMTILLVRYIQIAPSIFKKVIENSICRTIHKENNDSIARVSSDLTLNCVDHKHI